MSRAEEIASSSARRMATVRPCSASILASAFACERRTSANDSPVLSNKKKEETGTNIYINTYVQSEKVVTMIGQGKM